MHSWKQLEDLEKTNLSNKFKDLSQKLKDLGLAEVRVNEK